MRKVYAHLPRVQVRPLFFRVQDLNVSRMMTLMAVSQDGKQPLYLQVVRKILRDIGEPFDYDVFRRELNAQKFTTDQKAPLELRLDLLESFLVEKIIRHVPGSGAKRAATSIKRYFQPGCTPRLDRTYDFSAGGCGLDGQFHRRRVGRSLVQHHH